MLYTSRPLILAVPLLSIIVGCDVAAVPAPGIDPKNELPFGHIEAPVEGDTVQRQTTMRGWALDDHKVAEVRIFLDNKIVVHGPLTESRPDVSKAYPTYVHGNDTHGWGLLVPLGADTPPGSHAILVQALDNQGATRDIGLVYVTLAP
jgi:hypothetical protein